MNRHLQLFLICLLISAVSLFAQKKSAYFSGKVVDENENPFPNTVFKSADTKATIAQLKKL